MYTKTEKSIDYAMIIGGLAFYITSAMYITDKLTTVYSLNLM